MPTRFISATTSRPKSERPGSFELVAAGADQVLGVVGELDDADAELLEQPDGAELVLEGRDVLEAEHDPGPALALGAVDVLGRADLEDQVGVRRGTRPGTRRDWPWSPGTPPRPSRCSSPR